MAKITIEKELCKGCELCILQCPKSIIEIGNSVNSKGYNAAEQTDESKCIACKLCAVVCPEGAITVYR
jgi:2-oxoglutarate ferredoxin oxidoreductase subunit delta